MRLFLLLLLAFQVRFGFAQYPLGEPQLSTFKPVLPDGPSFPMSEIQRFLPPVKLGATAEDIRRLQQNPNMPHYVVGNSPAENQKANEIWMQERMMRDPAYNPALRNPNSRQQTLTPNEAVLKLVQEAGKAENTAQSISRLKSGYYQSAAFLRETAPFETALKALQEMLAGRSKLSLAKAYFAVEAAWGNPYLTQTEYKETIEQAVSFIREWMKEKGLNTENKNEVHLAIQKFISDTLRVNAASTLSKGQQPGSKAANVHLPFFYDYDDYGGEKDFRNYFLTKCLATGSGQCSSMPALYLVLADQLGATAYLTTAPQHSFIKYLDNSGHLVNYEPTSNWKISDKWYQDNMAISPPAVRSGLYLDTFNKRQIIADCVLRLGAAYLQRYGSTDGSFMARCTNIAQPEFTKPNLLLSALNSNQLSRMLQAVAENAGLKTFDDLSKSPQALRLFNKITENENYLKQIGYTEQPAQLYNSLIQEQEFKSRLQAAKGQDGKQKRSLFITAP